MLDVLNSERFADKAPAEVFATLLDKGDYLCSIRTMYRVLRASSQVRDRRNQLQHPIYARPELLATGPNQLWSWDITKLKGPQKWTSYHLYVILDVFSRYVVGWMVAPRESAALAKRLIAETIGKQELQAADLTIHTERRSLVETMARLNRADRSSMDLAIQVLELGDRAYSLYSQASAFEKRQLLELLCSNCEMGGGVLRMSLREPWSKQRSLVDAMPKEKALLDESRRAHPIWWAIQDLNQ